MVSIPCCCPGAGGLHPLPLTPTLSLPQPVVATSHGTRIHVSTQVAALPSYPCPTSVAPKAVLHTHTVCATGFGELEVAGTLHDPFSQGQHQCGTLQRERGWCVAEVMVQQGFPRGSWLRMVPVGSGCCQGLPN